MKLKIFTVQNIVARHNKSLHVSPCRGRVLILSSFGVHFNHTLPFTHVFTCSFGDMPESATPLFEDICLANFWTF